MRPGFDFTAREKNDHRDHYSSEDIHHRAGGCQRANPAHVFAAQIARSFAKFPDLEILHAKGFHYAIAADGFLQDLAKVSQPRAAFFRRTANSTGEPADRQQNQRHKHDRADSHAPVNRQQNHHEADQAENLPEKIREVIGKRAADLLHVVDQSGHHATDRIRMEKSDGLLKHSRVSLVPQIGDRGYAGVLNQACRRNIPRSLSPQK